MDNSIHDYHVKITPKGGNLLGIDISCRAHEVKKEILSRLNTAAEEVFSNGHPAFEESDIEINSVEEKHCSETAIKVEKLVEEIIIKLDRIHRSYNFHPADAIQRRQETLDRLKDIAIFIDSNYILWKDDI